MNYSVLAEGIFFAIYALVLCWWLAGISDSREKIAQKMALFDVEECDK